MMKKIGGRKSRSTDPLKKVLRCYNSVKSNCRFRIGFNFRPLSQIHQSKIGSDGLGSASICSQKQHGWYFAYFLNFAFTLVWQCSGNQVRGEERGWGHWGGGVLINAVPRTHGAPVEAMPISANHERGIVQYLCPDLRRVC